MANKIQIRKDSAARWADVNPVLSQGELGLDTTIGKIKIGNGVSSWSSLSFYTGNPNTLINGSHTLSLGADGSLTLPVGGLIKNSDGTNYVNLGDFTFRNSTMYNLNGINIENSDPTHSATSAVIFPSNATTSSLQLNNTYGAVSITSGINGGSLKNWTFGADGTLSVPTLSIDIHNGGVQSAQVLKFGDPAKQVIITGPTPAEGASAQRIIIQGQRATGNGEGGDVYLWGGDSDVNGGDIKIYAGDADSTSSGQGGYVNIDAGNGFNNGGNLTLSAGNANSNQAGSYGGNINITSGYAYNGTPGNIQLTTYNQSNSANLTWTFTNNGKLTLPVGGDIVNSAGTSVLTSTDIYKFSGGTIGTKDNPDTGNWGGYNISLDPGGESYAGINIPSVAQQNGNGSLTIYNNKSITNSIILNVSKGSFQFKGNGELELPTAPFTGVTNVNQLISTRIYRSTPNNDATAINNAKDLWLGNETEYVNIRNQDEVISGYTRPWHNMPSWEAYPLIMSYENPQGQLPPPSNLVPTTKTAMDAYLAWRQLQANIDIVTGNKTFSFENTGNLTLTNGGQLMTGYPGQGYLEDTVTLASNDKVFIASKNYNIDIGINQNAAKIRNTTNYWNFLANGTTEFAGSWKFDNQFGTTIFPNNRLLAPANTNLDIKVTNNGANPVLSLSNTSKTWTFDKDGKFNLPNNANIAKSTNVELDNAMSSYNTAAVNWAIYAEQETITAAALNITPTDWPWLNWRITDVNAASLLAELEAAWTAQNNPTSPPSPLVFNPAISQSLYTEIKTKILLIQSTAALVTLLSTSIDIVAGTEKLTLLGNGKLQVPDIIQNIPEENLILRTRYAVASSPPGTPLYTNIDWTFGTNGTLKFPDTTIQSTAYVSKITNTAANGSAYLTPTSVMTRGTRLEVRAVYTDPNSLNMEFRYQGLGDQVAITANNGTNIFSGTSIGYGTTWTRFNPAVFVNPGEKAEVVICDHSYHKIYRVTAIMRDVPTGDDGTGSVYCTIEELK